MKGSSKTYKGSLSDLADAYTKFFMVQVKRASKDGNKSFTQSLDSECNFRFPPLRKLGIDCCCFLTNFRDNQKVLTVLQKIRMDLAFRGIASAVEIEPDDDGYARYSLRMVWDTLHDGQESRPSLQECAYYYLKASLPENKKAIQDFWKTNEKRFMDELL